MPASIPEEIIQRIATEIVPHIRASVRDSLAAYQQGLSEDGDKNYFGNYALGCCCWENTYNRLLEALSESLFFKVATCKRVMEIRVSSNEGEWIFHVARVDDATRIPKAGKTIKRLAQEQLFLSPEIRSRMISQGVYHLAYDVDRERGLGAITLEILTCLHGNSFQATTLHTFDAGGEFSYTERPAPEVLRPAQAVKRAERSSALKAR